MKNDKLQTRNGNLPFVIGHLSSIIVKHSPRTPRLCGEDRESQLSKTLILEKLMRNVYSLPGFNIRLGLFTFFVCALALTIAGCARKEPEQPNVAKEEAPKTPAPYKVNFPLGLAAESAVIPPDNPL